MSKKNFQQFIKKEDKGAKLKEKIRQEKKKLRQETKEYFDKKKLESKGRLAPEQRESQPERSTTRSKTHSDTRQGAKRTADDLITKKGPAQKSGKPVTEVKEAGVMPLNKYVAHAGICSRRDAADLVKSGKISVNGQVITEPGFKVNRGDEIKIQGKKISSSRNLVYILLNKPKDHITTTEDPQGRKTVMDIVKKATTERVFPIGRLDRNTTGVLLLTNDGELAQKLSHPSYEVRKIYEVTLDKPLAKKDFDELLNGLTLEDGFIAPDSLAYADARDKSVIGIEIHSGKNRIVRRMFEKLGYDVRNLDRVMYANLTKKNVERGKWRFLQEKEIRLLKFMNASYSKKK
jgi:23S rRNA pseudouridine2605 synthase